MAKMYIDPATYEVGDKVKLRNKTRTPYLESKGINAKSAYVVSKCKTIISSTGNYQICWIGNTFFTALELEPADKKDLVEYNKVIDKLKVNYYQMTTKTASKSDRAIKRKNVKKTTGNSSAFKSLTK